MNYRLVGRGKRDLYRMVFGFNSNWDFKFEMSVWECNRVMQWVKTQLEMREYLWKSDDYGPKLYLSKCYPLYLKNTILAKNIGRRTNFTPCSNFQALFALVNEGLKKMKNVGGVACLHPMV